MSEIRLADGKGLIRGDDYTIKVTLNVVITDATVFFTVNEDDNPTSDATAAFQKINGPGEHFDAANGETHFYIEPDDTFNMEPGAYHYDIQVVTGDNKVVSTRRGQFILDSDITRSVTA